VQNKLEVEGHHAAPCFSMRRLIDVIRQTQAQFRGALDEWPEPVPETSVRGKKILLVYLFNKMGDGILLAPVVRALLDAGAKPPIGLVLRERAVQIWRTVDLPTRIYTLPIAIDDEQIDPDDQEALETQLEKGRYDIAVDLNHTQRFDSRELLEASGAPIRLGWLDPGEDPDAAGLTHGAYDFRHQAATHWSRYCAMPLVSLGIRKLQFSVPWKIKEEHQDFASELYGRRPRILMVPGTERIETRLPKERYIELGRWLRDLGASLVLTGSPSESAWLKTIAKGITESTEDAIPVYAQKNLLKLLALVEASDVVVSNDTGPMHLAFLSGRPTVGLFTRMSPCCWGPPERRPDHIVLRSDENASKPAQQAMMRLAVHHVESLLKIAEKTTPGGGHPGGQRPTRKKLKR
jgi:ADP-heptose:LPS heptosyltransferase